MPQRTPREHKSVVARSALLIAHYCSRRRVLQLKLGAHSLDLRGLLFELGRENLHLFPLLLYLFLLLRDRCFQLLNFVIEYGLGPAAREIAGAR